MNPTLLIAAGGSGHPELRQPEPVRLRARQPPVLLGLVQTELGSMLWPALRQHIVLMVIAVAIGFAISSGAGAARVPLPVGSSSR